MLLYIHIPYCDSKCHYCSFNSYVDRFDTRRAYMDALREQLAFELQRSGATAGSIETLFIGGGTPSTVAPELYAPLFEELRPYLAKDAECSSEANPNSATSGWLAGMKELGIGRISFGVQSFDESKLRFLNRAHSPRQAVEAIETAAALGFERLSLDLIYNCRGDDQTLLERDIKQALELPITHLSAYELTLEEGTPFAQRPTVRQENLELARFVVKRIVDGGLAQYEISNFGEPCRHNLGYWRLDDYIGLGAGAVGFLGKRRFYPPSSIDAYLANPLSHDIEELDDEELMTEWLFLGLRSSVGVEASVLDDSASQRAKLLLQEGKLEFRRGRYYNPDYFLADELALFLLA